MWGTAFHGLIQGPGILLPYSFTWRGGGRPFSFSVGKWHKSFPEIVCGQEVIPVAAPNCKGSWEVCILCAREEREWILVNTQWCLHISVCAHQLPPPSSSTLTSFSKERTPNPTQWEHLAWSPGSLGCLILSHQYSKRLLTVSRSMKNPLSLVLHRSALALLSENLQCPLTSMNPLKLGIGKYPLQAFLLPCGVKFSCLKDV